MLKHALINSNQITAAACPMFAREVRYCPAQAMLLLLLWLCRKLSPMQDHKCTESDEQLA
jgi:hypothetical protein